MTLQEWQTLDPQLIYNLYTYVNEKYSGLVWTESDENTINHFIIPKEKIKEWNTHSGTMNEKVKAGLAVSVKIELIVYWEAI
jgi:hypothetical protein